MRFFGWILAVCLLLPLIGCAPTTASVPDFSYADQAFSATVRGAFVRTAGDGYTGEPSLAGDSLTEVRQAVAATVTVDAPGAEGARGMTVTFLEPSVLAGVTVVREAGTGMVSIRWPCAGDATEGGAYSAFALSVEGAETLLRFAEALLPMGDIAQITPFSDGETTVERRSRDGDFSAVFRFSGENGYALPTHVTVITPRERMELYIT